ncbi:MAG: mercuric transport protein MerTP [Bacteroidetes bacterium]|nr:mercuric transport protein MerTP [Bacteroidota bacterium]MBU1372684.1 mercuric transport protein MerTP [Bacteroidota bacterium]MBU1484880.1 mercuric transport protein MerTP [Bacteroidota bacterium]MBU1761555.1 mercuric transport protein MerTP [Bacteroidota bacterium]MBU2266520.1 mercuric transport protein MerTP [Bacteroidota bacterium]
MNNQSESGKLAGASILSAIAASLCCITPVLALISGAGGIASSFSWLEPVRPYLLGITVLVLGFAWYQKLKPRTAEEIQCACDEDEKPPFMQTKKFLGMVTVFAFLMMAFPYYGQFFYPKADKEVVVVSSDNIKEVKFNVSGMTCASCEEHVKHAVNELPGIVRVSANSEEGIANVKFDNSKTDKVTIIKAIDRTGYKVSGEDTKVNLANSEAGHVCGPNGCK